MIPLRRRTMFVLLATLAASETMASTAGAGETGDVITVGNRCAVYGPGAVELGGGACGRIDGMDGGYVRIKPANRIEPGPGQNNVTGWSSGATSHAALRSEGIGMVPGAGESRHLRLGSESDPYLR